MQSTEYSCQVFYFELFNISPSFINETTKVVLIYFFPPLERTLSSNCAVFPMLYDAKVWLSFKNPEECLSCCLLIGIPPNALPIISFKSFTNVITPTGMLMVWPDKFQFEQDASVGTAMRTSIGSGYFFANSSSGIMSETHYLYQLRFEMQLLTLRDLFLIIKKAFFAIHIRWWMRRRQYSGHVSVIRRGAIWRVIGHIRRRWRTRKGLVEIRHCSWWCKLRCR